MINIAFFGTSNFSKNIFLELISISKKNNYNLPITVSKQNKLNKKRNTKSFSLVCKISILNSILNYRPQIINNKTFYVFKKKTNILIIAGYGKILPKIFINKHIKLLNIHPSLLPKLKGPAPIQKSIQKNKKKTGISILKITPQ
jgi:methionyl-tRNA formyltransferase